MYFWNYTIFETMQFHKIMNLATSVRYGGLCNINFCRQFCTKSMSKRILLIDQFFATLSTWVGCLVIFDLQCNMNTLWSTSYRSRVSMTTILYFRSVKYNLFGMKKSHCQLPSIGPKILFAVHLVLPQLNQIVIMFNFWTYYVLCNLASY